MKEKLRLLLSRYKKLTLVKQLMLCVIPIVVVAYLISCIIFAEIMQQRLSEDAITNMKDVTDKARYYMESRLNDIYEQFSIFESNYVLYNLKNSLKNKPNSNQVAQYYIDLDVQLKSILASNQNCIDFIYINFNDNDIVVQKINQTGANVNYRYDLWRERYPDSGIYFKALQDEPNVVGKDIFAVIFRLYESSDLNGIILYGVKDSFFTNILGQMKIYDDSVFYILTEGGELLKLKNNEDKPPLSEESIAHILSSSEQESVLIENGQYLYAVPINRTGWRLVLSVPEENVMANRAILLQNYIVIAGIAIFMVFLMIWNSAQFISAPLRRLSERVTQMKNKELQAEFDVDGCQEIEILNTELVRMNDYSVHLMDEIKQERDLKRKAELAMLQEQIKPHFLYNALYSIQQLCEMGENERASRMIGALSGFYRLGISGGSDIITIQKELEHVDNYLQIQKMRYYDKFDYIIDCDSVISQYKIPKLVLQPLVENAIYHGIKQSERKGFISILGCLDGDDIILEVHDDGVGMTAERMEELHRYLAEEGGSGGIGLRNVNYRIKKTYGDTYGIEFFSERDVDTCFRVRLATRIIFI